VNGFLWKARWFAVNLGMDLESELPLSWTKKSLNRSLAIAEAKQGCPIIPSAARLFGYTLSAEVCPFPLFQLSCLDNL
jgi:hypothetical protein